LVELCNWVIGDAVEDVAQPHKGINFQELARRDEAAQYRCRPATSITAEEGPVSTADSHHAFILPISGKKLMFTTVGTRFTVDDCECGAANNVPAAGLSMSRWRPAQ
jgi:hypothetical protein